MKRYGFILFLLSWCLLCSCASFRAQRIPITFERPAECQEFFDHLDEEIEEAGGRDAAYARVPGFPYLRSSRFLAALKKDLTGDGERAEWVFWMQKLDLKARKKEINNLKKELPDRNRLYARVESCSSKLLHHDQTRPEFYPTLYPLVRVPDEYSFLMRAAGLYPLLAIPVAMVTDNVRKKIKTWFQEDLKDLPVEGRLTTFIPETKTVMDENEIERMIEDSKKNPLRIPRLDESQERDLAEVFAPVIIQDVAASYDWPGQIVWKNNRTGIDPERPAVYYYLTHAFFKGEPVLQINYILWYSERAGKRSPQIEHGPLDGLTARISLDHQGKPFMLDVVNDCGCYHFFSPDRERVDRVIPRPFQFDPFVPQWLPTVPPGKRLGIRVNSGWHQVERLFAAEESSNPIYYRLIPYDVLEALPHDDGQKENIFDSCGIAKKTKRVERFILFSMGIPSVGSMRQRGHHAIELIGRIHFDDPDLFDRSFLFK